jgi:hypothetical protein
MMIAAQTKAPAIPCADAERSHAGLVGKVRPAVVEAMAVAVVVSSVELTIEVVAFMVLTIGEIVLKSILPAVVSVTAAMGDWG